MKISLKVLKRKQKDIDRIAKCYLTQAAYRKRNCMLFGGVQDVVNEMWVDFFIAFRNSKSVEVYSLPVLVINRAKWTMGRLLAKRKINYDNSDDFFGQLASHEENVEFIADQKYLSKIIFKYLDQELDWRGSLMIKMRYGIEPNHCYGIKKGYYTHKEIGDLLNCSAERVRKIIAKSERILFRSDFFRKIFFAYMINIKDNYLDN